MAAQVTAVVAAVARQLSGGVVQFSCQALSGAWAVRWRHIHKYPYEAVRNTHAKNTKCHQHGTGTASSTTTASAGTMYFGHSGGHQPDIKENGRQAQDRLQVCFWSQEGPDRGPGLHLQRQAESHQGRQDQAEEIRQGHAGRQEDGIHQADQPHQQAPGQGTGGPQSR